MVLWIIVHFILLGGGVTDYKGFGSGFSFIFEIPLLMKEGGGVLAGGGGDLHFSGGIGALRLQKCFCFRIMTSVRFGEGLKNIKTTALWRWRGVNG